MNFQKNLSFRYQSIKQSKDLLTYQYLYEDKYVGGEFVFNKENLTERGDKLVIIIWKNRPGVLSRIVREFNSAPDFCNKYKKFIEEKLLPAIQFKITELSMDYSDQDEEIEEE